MPKNKLLGDLDELLAKSQRLTSNVSTGGLVIGGLGTDFVRGVSELREASKDLSRINIDESSTLEALRQLSKRNFDAKKLHEEVASKVIHSSEKIGDSRLEGVDIDGYLAHHHDMIVLKSIDDAMKEADRNVQAIQRRWADNEWSNFRNYYITTLGHRVDNWGHSATILAPPHGPDSSFKAADKNFTPGKPAASRIMNITAGSPYSFDMSTFRGTPSSTLGKTHITFDTPLVSNTAMSAASTRAAPRPNLSELLTKHSEIVRKLIASTHSGHITTVNGASSVQISAISTPFADLAASFSVPLHGSSKAVVIDGLTKHDMTAYKTILLLLSSIAGEDGNKPSAPGLFSAVCFEDDLVKGRALQQRGTLTSGAIRFLELQMWQQWSQAVDEAVMCGELKLPPSEQGRSQQQRLRAYVNYQQSLGVIPPSSMQTLSTESNKSEPTSLWAFVYHCIRIGQLSAATSELQKVLSASFLQAESSAVIVLSCLTRAIKDNTLSLNDKQELHYAVGACYGQFQREMRLPEEKRDVYKAFVLMLLSVGKMQTGASCTVTLPDFSIEDFMWTELWFIQSCRRTGIAMKQPLTQAKKAALYDEDEEIPPAIGEVALFDLILEYGGADYFDRDRLTPFKYATVLLSCQRYGDAILYLWTANKIVPAVHLTVLFLHYGLILPHVPLNENPIHFPSVGGANPSSGDIFPDTVLKRFVDNQTFRHYPEVKVDYLLSLDSNWLKYVQDLFVDSETAAELKEVSRIKSQERVSSALEHLIVSVQREQLAAVVGDLVTDASITSTSIGNAVKYRSGGRLDEYLDEEQVNIILRRSAYSLLSTGGDLEAERAAALYQLAGSHVDAMDVLCKQLAPLIVPSHRNSYGSSGQMASGTKPAPSAQRDFWRKLGEQFIESFLTNKGVVSSSVLRSLTQSPLAGYSVSSAGLADALKTLTALTYAVDHYLEGEMGKVLETLDALPLKLLPRDESEVAAATAATQRVYEGIRSVLDEVILIAMRSIRNLFETTRSSHQKSGGLGSASNLFTDKDAKLQNLKTRASAIQIYATRIKDKLNLRDTLSTLSKIESSLL